MEAQRKHQGSIQYDSVLLAWRAQIADAAHHPALKRRLVHQERELLPRFASQYANLQALPRRARRALQRQWKRSLAGVALLLALGQTPALAGIITVGPGCTLVNAITSANTDTAIGGCTAGSLGDTVVLPAAPAPAQLLTTVNNTTLGPTGLPVVTTPIIIQGNGATIRRAVLTAPEFRIFSVATGGQLTLLQTTVSGGKPTAADGGGVYNLGTLRVTNTTIDGNSASRGGGVANFGTFALSGSTISGNTATDATNGDGGGVFNSFRSKTFTMVNSTISGNTAGDDGGGVNNDDGATATIINSTISENTATDHGGGVNNSGGPFGSSGIVTLDSTLISGNTAPAPNGREVYSYIKDKVTTNNFNLFGFNGVSGLVNITPGVTDVVPPAGVLLTDILEPLADNPGLTALTTTTQTHALVAGSPALNAVGEGCPPPVFDQRGITRPQGIACDIGAFELAPPAPPPTGTTLQFSVPAFNVIEGGVGVLTVTRTGTPTGQVSVDFSTGGGAAVEGADYAFSSGTLTFPNGIASRNIAVPTINDTDQEAAETVNLTLSTPVGATLGTQSTAALTIAASDTPTGGATLSCLGAIATKVGTNAGETINGTAGPDVISGLGGNDRIFGLGGNDLICGGGGNDQMNGGAGSDQCNGGGGVDTAAACEIRLNIP